MFGDDDLERRVKEVRQQWKDAVGTVQSSRERGRGGGADGGSTSLSETFADNDLSPWTLAKYMLGSFVLLIVYATFGIVNPFVSIVSGIVGAYMVRKGGQGNHLAMLLGIVFLLHPGIVLMTIIGLNFTVIGALIGIAGFALSAMEGEVQRSMGQTGYILFQSISAVIIPIWFLALANVILSVFAGNWLNLSFAATVITAVGTSAYLFAGGNIADGAGVYLGLGSAFLSIWERAFIGYDAHGYEEWAFLGTTGASFVIFVYGVYLGVATPSLAFGPVVPFFLGMFGPLALYWLLHDIKTHHLQAAGQAAYRGGAAVGGAVAGGGRRVASAPGRAVGAAQERFGGPAEEEGEGGGQQAMSGGQVSAQDPNVNLKREQNKIDEAWNLRRQAEDQGVAVRDQWQKIEDAQNMIDQLGSGASVSETEWETTIRALENAIIEYSDALGESGNYDYMLDYTSSSGGLF